IDPQVLRFFMLMVHYRHPINYNDELLENAKSALDRLKTTYNNLNHRKASSTNLADNNDEWLGKIKEIQEEFIKEMDDDFNTANAISLLFELSKQANYYLMEKSTSEIVIDAFLKEFEDLFFVLGLQLKEEEEIVDEEIEALI